MGVEKSPEKERLRAIIMSAIDTAICTQSAVDPYIACSALNKIIQITLDDIKDHLYVQVHWGNEYIRVLNTIAPVGYSEEWCKYRKTNEFMDDRIEICKTINRCNQLFDGLKLFVEKSLELQAPSDESPQAPSDESPQAPSDESPNLIVLSDYKRD